MGRGASVGATIGAAVVRVGAMVGGTAVAVPVAVGEGIGVAVGGTAVGVCVGGTAVGKTAVGTRVGESAGASAAAAGDGGVAEAGVGSLLLKMAPIMNMTMTNKIVLPIQPLPSIRLLVLMFCVVAIKREHSPRIRRRQANVSQPYLLLIYCIIRLPSSRFGAGKRRTETVWMVMDRLACFQR